MKKISLVVLSLILLLTSLPVTASASSLKLSVDNREVRFSDALPYRNGSTIMIPLRQTLAALGLKIGFAQSRAEISITASGAALYHKAGSDQIRFSDGRTLTLGAKSAVKHNRIYVPLSFFEQALGFAVSFHEDTGEAVIIASRGNEEVVKSVVQHLASGKYAELFDDYLEGEIKQVVSAEALKAGWEQLIAAIGSYSGIERIEPDSDTIRALLAFSKGKAVLTLQLNADNRVTGLSLKPIAPQADLPNGLTEEEVVFQADASYPLTGTLTLPKGASGPLPAVVLVHGSGPSDRDETVGTLKPFRDIAWGLAQKGIAVLRYEKRTYAYGQSFTPDMLSRFTVKEETVDDAIAAAKLLKDDKRIDASQVYVAGHSLGGMLAPRIDADGGNFAGLIILAGSTRTLWEIIADQNADYIATLGDQDPQKKANEAWLAAELERARSLGKLSDAEAMAQTLFGIPAFYFKEMDSRSAAELAPKLTKPIFVLQGEDDVQVYADKDYPLWQKALHHNVKASYKLYPGLNHFFADSKGSVSTNAQVIQDMAEWIKKPK
ncbi:alpha/beta fold hydrolase [Cohnella boryungensis]|uniref:Alpha/beta fold hydrolase n=1 Tax=Cohnella boryungensis TaxID=768479 RepID=A0ABV8S754_9BACL